MPMFRCFFCAKTNVLNHMAFYLSVGVLLFFVLRVYQLKKHVPKCNKHRFVGVPPDFVQAFLLQIRFFDPLGRIRSNKFPAMVFFDFSPTGDSS